MRIIDIVDFIEKNKKPTMFLEWPTRLQLAMEIDRAVKQGTIFYSVDSTGRLSGMILAECRENEKVIFVTENLSMNLGNLRAFAAKAKEKWPDYTLRWIKNGIPKFHDTAKVYKKLAPL